VRRISTISSFEIGFCALNKSASMTWARFILVRTDRGLDRVRDPVCVFVDLLELAAFDQESDLWFGSGIAKQDAAFAGELALNFIAELDQFAQFLARRVRFEGEIAFSLRIFFQNILQY